MINKDKNINIQKWIDDYTLDLLKKTNYLISSKEDAEDLLDLCLLAVKLLIVFGFFYLIFTYFDIYSKFKDMLVEQTGGEHNLNIEYYDSKLFPSDFQILNSDKKMKSSSSQGKTDIFVQWEDQKIKISAKKSDCSIP